MSRSIAEESRFPWKEHNKDQIFLNTTFFSNLSPGLCLWLGWYCVWCWSLRSWFVFLAFCVLCLCDLRWQLFNLLNLRLTFQLFPQSWPSSSCSKRRESPSLPRRWRSIQTSNSKKIPWYSGGFTELNYSPLLDRKSITGRLQVRAPMGVHKRIHIQRICQLPEVWKLGENGKRCDM